MNLDFFQAIPQVETWDYVSPGPKSLETGKINEFRGKRSGSGGTTATTVPLPLEEKIKQVEGQSASQLLIQRIYKHAKAIVDEVEAGVL